MSEARQYSTSNLEPIQSAWSDVAAELERERKRLYEELRTYPTPITACDQQFNYLLERQAMVAAELQRLQAILDGNVALGDAVGLIEEFVRSSDCIDAEVKRAIRSRLAELTAPEK